MGRTIPGMSDTYTQGDWVAEGRAIKAEINGEEVVIGVAKLYIIEQENGTYGDRPQARANARLMAASPDLLEACYSALHVLTPATPRMDGKDRQRVELCEAIAKATGQKFKDVRPSAERSPNGRILDELEDLKATNADLLAALQVIRGWCIPGMNWTDEIGRSVLDLADAAIANATQSEVAS